MKRTFDLGDILSITHDRLVSDRHMAAVYDICNFLTQDNLFTQQLPRVHDECAAWLLMQHPQLREIEKVSDEWAKGRGEWWKPWLAEQKAKYGDALEIEPLPHGIHEYKNPIAEAVEMVGPDRVIGIDRGYE